jgi:hypothetical protein
MAMKLTKRKGFNFFRSYYDVYNELETDKDKIAFIDALLDRQFLGIKPINLKGMAKFAYISQTNSIDSQVKGYEDKTKTNLDGTPYYVDFLPPTEPPTEPPTHGGNLPPTEQEKEKVQEKEKEQSIKPPTDKEAALKFLTFFNAQILKHKGKEGKFSVLSKTDLNNLKKLKESFPDHNDWLSAFSSMYESPWVQENNMLTPTHFLVNANFQKYLNTEIKKPKREPNEISPIGETPEEITERVRKERGWV